MRASDRSEGCLVDDRLGADERRRLRLKARAATLDALRALGGRASRDAILQRSRADGGFTRRELAASAPSASAGKYADLVDHQLSWALTDLKRDGLVDNPVRGVWTLVGVALELPEPAVEGRVHPQRLRELQAMPYHAYLRTPEWRRARAAALVRAGNACSLDVTHTDDLEVHHRTYERLGRELASDLVVLCRSCHRLHHREAGRSRRPPDTAARSTPPPTTRPRRPAEARPTRAARRSLLRRLLTR